MTILKGIPRLVSPQMLRVLAEMGHGDMLVIADANFPAVSVAASTPGGLVRADGSSATEVMTAVTQLLPLDAFVEAPVAVMARIPEHVQQDLPVPIVDEFKAIAEASEQQTINVEHVERFEFYERAKRAFAVIATGETALYGNVILTKGVLAPSSD